MHYVFENVHVFKCFCGSRYNSACSRDAILTLIYVIYSPWGGESCVERRLTREFLRGD